VQSLARRCTLAVKCSVPGEINHDGTGLALHVLDAHSVTVTGAELMQQWNGVMVVAKAHGFPRLQGIERAKDGRMAKAFGHPAGIKRVNSLSGHMA